MSQVYEDSFEGYNLSFMLQVYEDKLKLLKTATRDVFDRVKELNERPVVIEAFNGLVNHTEHFLKAMKNFTGEDLPFTQVEYDALEKLLTDSKVLYCIRLSFVVICH